MVLNIQMFLTCLCKLCIPANLETIQFTFIGVFAYEHTIGRFLPAIFIKIKQDVMIYINFNFNNIMYCTR